MIKVSQHEHRWNMSLFWITSLFFLCSIDLAWRIRKRGSALSESISQVPILQASSVKWRTAFKSKTVMYLSQVWSALVITPGSEMQSGLAAQRRASTCRWTVTGLWGHSWDLETRLPPPVSSRVWSPIWSGWDNTSSLRARHSAHSGAPLRFSADCFVLFCFAFLRGFGLWRCSRVERCGVYASGALAVVFVRREILSGRGKVNGTSGNFRNVTRGPAIFSTALGPDWLGLPGDCVRCKS